MYILKFVELMFPGYNLNRSHRRFLMKCQPEKKVEKTPDCFGQYHLISWSARAENCCQDCPYSDRCIDAGKDD